MSGSLLMVTSAVFLHGGIITQPIRGVVQLVRGSLCLRVSNNTYVYDAIADVFSVIDSESVFSGFWGEHAVFIRVMTPSGLMGFLDEEYVREI